MKHKSLDELRDQAKVSTRAPDEAPHVLRRQRLERLAAVLDRHDGPIKPLSRIEYLPSSEWGLLRTDQSPLTIATRMPCCASRDWRAIGSATQWSSSSSRREKRTSCCATAIMPALRPAR
jgi:hypothetical protein